MTIVESFSGIRGIYGTELTDSIAKTYVYSYFLYLKKLNPGKKLKIVIGMDTRPSGKQVYDSIISALNCEIKDIGVLPTPIIENSVRDFFCDGGIIITASHNEPEYNGFKFLDKDGCVVSQEGMEFIIKKFHEIENDFIKIKVNQQEIIECRKEAIEYYKTFVRKIIGDTKPLDKFKIIVDPNGGSGIISKEIFDEYNIKAEYMNMKEGKFYRLVEPTKDSLKYLVNKIQDNNADFAIGFDCDSDRVEIILKNGEIVSGNHLLALITDYILSKMENPSDSTVVVNDATSYVVKDIVEKYEGKFKEVEVGEVNVTHEMEKNDSLIGGEGSNGGIIISPSKCRDGILSTILLLKILDEKQKSLDDLIKELPVYFYYKEKLKLKEDFWNIRSKIEDHYKKKGFTLSITGDMTGGLKAIDDDSWIWFRQSKTEDKVLRIIADSKNKNIALKLLSEAKVLFNNISR
jgi:phosphomannomutase / phosphoglucomutase